MSTRRLIFGLFGIALLGVAPSQPAAAEADPPFMRHLFPPELVMRNQHEIELSSEQRKVITGAIHDTQGRVLEIQWGMQDEARKLEALLAADRIDREAALRQVGLVLDLEQKVKKAHMGLLIRIKNALSLEQRKRLDSLRPDELAWLLDLP